MKRGEGAALPPDWRTVRFGDVVRNVRVTERDPLAAGLERYVGLEHLDPESLHVRHWGLVAEGTTFTLKFVRGQVLFGKRRAYQRKVAVAGFDGVCSGDLLVFEPGDDRLLPELLPFIVQSEGFFAHALRTSAGSLSPRTRWRDLAAYELSLPPLAEQRRIAEILWAADEAVESGVLLSTRIRDAAGSWFRDLSQKVSDGEGNPVLEEPLEKAALLITDGDHNPPRRCASGIPHLVVRNIVDRRISLDDCTSISAEDFERVARRYSPQPGDLIITCVGSIGRVALVPAGLTFSADRSLAIVRFDPQKVLPEYGLELVSSRAVQQQIEERSIGTAQQHLFLGDIRSLLVHIPPLDMQRAILAVMRLFQNAADAAARNLLRLKELKSVLLNAMLECVDAETGCR